MATLTLKNFPDDLYAQLKDRAAQNRRSLNREAILCLEEALVGQPRENAARTLAALRRARARLHRIHLTDRDLAAARNSGRK
jgi:plasmid stability protein